MQNKTHYTAFVASSIDGRISLKSKSAPDWTSKEDWNFFQKSLAHYDAVIVGRNTYIAAANALRKRNTFVFSTRMKTGRQQGSITFVNPQKTDISKLLENYTKVAILGGGNIYRFMLEKGLLNEMYVTIEPLIFGRGKEMFMNGTQTTQAQLVSVKKLNKKGTLLLHYKVESIKKFLGRKS